jgi:hypothetical protein
MQKLSALANIPGLKNWHGGSLDVGYVIGNGKMYIVGALGRELIYDRCPYTTDLPAPLSRISMVIGPMYAYANFGHGWEIQANVDDQPVAWDQETVLMPAPDQPDWGVKSQGEELTLELRDQMDAKLPLFLRQVTLTRPAGMAYVRVTVDIPVVKDVFRSPDSCTKEIEPTRNSIIITWNPKATPVYLFDLPLSLDPKIPPRVLVTTVRCERPDTKIWVDETGLHADCGLMAGGDTVNLNIWLSTATSKAKAQRQIPSTQPIEGVKNRMVWDSILERVDGQNDRLLQVLNNSISLCHATTAVDGSSLANPYMFPLRYLRDQQGTFQLFLAIGEYETAFKALAFHTAMQNRYGIQDWYSPVAPEPVPDPYQFDPQMKWANSHWATAEYPSYIALFARDYYQATNSIEPLKGLYPRLVDNILCQKFGEYDLLDSPGDESYTQLVGIDNELHFTDSNLLFIGAARFVAQMADMLGKTQDAAKFLGLAERTWQALLMYNWDIDKNFFTLSKNDRRIALDPALRWFWAELGDPQDPMAQGCLSAVLEQLINPIRVVPDKPLCAGMDPGYLLYALTRSQHPAVHDTAQLVLEYAVNGTFCEYYTHSGNTVQPRYPRGGGILRSFESGICATALLQYLLGMRLNMPLKQVFLQPHLPPCWPGWQSREIDISGEGTLQMRLERKTDGEVIYTLQRRGGQCPLQLNVEFGVFGPHLQPKSTELTQPKGRLDLLQAAITLAPASGTQNTIEQKLIFVTG